MRASFINYNEAVRGSRIKLRSALTERGFATVPLDDLGYSGSDVAWYTGHDPYRVVGVQIKTLSDYWASWTSGLLQDEMYRLVQSVDIPVLLIEEMPRMDHRTGMVATSYGILGTSKNPVSWTALAHSIGDLTSGSPSPFFLMLSPDIRYSIKWLTEIGPKRFDGDSFAGWKRIQLPPKADDKALQFLLSWVGIGEERARALLRKYHTPREVLKAIITRKAVEVDGIGRVTVEKVIQQFDSMYLGDIVNNESSQ